MGVRVGDGGGEGVGADGTGGPGARSVVRRGQPLPLIDVDRQSLVVRLGGLDCRVRVWWQPSDGAWYGGLEAPAGTPMVNGRRLAVGGGLLDGIPDVLAGNLVCRALDDESATVGPARDAWRRRTHGLVWEAAG